jgi:tetratricopeptide (TPR) repeat protein
VIADHDDYHKLAFLERGKCHQAMKENEKALADFDRAVQLGEDEPESYFLRGGLHEDMGNIDAAVKDYV